MKKIAKFEKVSFEQFKKDWLDTFNGALILHLHLVLVSKFRQGLDAKSTMVGL